MCVDDTIKNALYDKSYTCPLCQTAFKSKTIKSGKNQLVAIDLDLYAHYTLINPLFYDTVVCPTCGYTSLVKTLAPLMPKQKEWLRTHFTKGVMHTNYSEYATYEEALLKHKVALLACITRKGKLSEQAYIVLNIAWLYRDLNDTANEQIFLKRAFEGFEEAYSKESFPMMGMDAPTITYLLAALAYETQNYDRCRQYLSLIFAKTDYPARIKERAFKLKELLKNNE